MTEPQGIGDLQSADKGSGARFNSGKPPIGLIPFRILAESFRREGYIEGHTPTWIEALDLLGKYQEGGSIDLIWQILSALGPTLDVWDETAQVFDFGKKKYAAWNWAKGMPWSVPLECAARHLRKMILGEWLDADSGLPHRGHVGCNLVMLLHYAQNFPQGEDRPPAELFRP